MSETLTDKLEAIDSGTDFSDPNTYTKLLYPEGEAQTDQRVQPQTDTTGDTQAADAAAAQAAAAVATAKDSSATPAAATEQVEPAPAGIATKDGKHVIPMAVLTDTRDQLRKQKERADELAAANLRLQQELQARATAAAAPATAAPAAEITAEELAAIEVDFPELGPTVAKLVKANQALQAQVQEVASRPTVTASAEPEVSLQELIDQRPLLSQWQAKGGLAWQAAVNADAALQAQPEWANKPEAERFAEVERQIAAEFGIPMPQATTAAATPAAAPTPGGKPAPAAPVTSTVTPTLTDFSGTPATVGDPMAGMAVGQMVDKAMNMDMEALRKMAGLSY